MWKFTGTVVFMIIMLASQLCYAQEIRESTVKAAWFSHFSKFIEWPNINDTTSTFVIKVLGKDEFENNLDKIYTTRSIKNIPVTIEYIDKLVDIGHCHILYISSDKRKQLEEILSEVSGKPILTISAEDGLGEKGVMINFFSEQNKIGFEFNLIAAKRKDLAVSFRLLELAKIIN